MNELLCDVYSCAEAPERWRELLDSVCTRMAVRSAVLQVLEHRNGRFHRVWEARDSYSLAHRERHDLILNNDHNPRLRAPDPGRGPSRRMVIRDQDVFAQGSLELAELRARLAALELGHDMRGMIELAQGRYLAFVVHRAAADGRQLGAEEEALLSELLPHLRQSLRLMGQVHGARQRSEFLARASEMLGAGVLLCTADGVLSWANAAGQAVLERSPYLSVRSGRVRATSSQDRASFERLLAGAARRAADGAPAPVQLALGRHDLAEMVQVLAVGTRATSEEAHGPEGAEILLLLCRPGRPLDVPPHALSELFGLSGAEARLTAGLCHGLTVADYARSRGISVGTARIQLKSAMAKTGSPRQSDLVRRVCASLAASLAAGPAEVLVRPADPGRRRRVH